MTILGYFFAVVIGFAMGLMGGGGAILAVMVFLYIFQIPDIGLVTAYSIMMIGLGATVATIRHAKQGNIEFKMGLIFAAPVIIGTYFARIFLVDLIPDPIFSIGEIEVSKRLFILLILCTLLIYAALKMVFSQQRKEITSIDPDATIPYVKMITVGLAIGIVSGLVGAGGGFLIIPVLVMLLHFPIKKAIGTTLLIITLKSYVGFIGDLQAGRDIDWAFLGVFGALVVVGVLLGTVLSAKIASQKLRGFFGWFILTMAGLILVKELWLV